MIKKISFTILSTFTIFLIQYQQSSGCQCCQSCRCCNQNNASLPNEEELRFDDRDIYYYLKEKKELTPQKIDKIAKNYLRLINEADDTVKTLDEVATDILTPKIIKQYLGINEAINEIDKLSSVREKIIKINWIVNDEFINKKYNYEDSNKKLPRCLVKHEDNDCALEAHLTAMLGNPYRVKFFYLLYYLFKNGFLSKENYPVTFEVCKFFYEAVNHPNFTDTIRCISIMKAYFDHYSNSAYAQSKDENGRLEHTYGSFQTNSFSDIIVNKICNELNIGQSLKFNYYNSLSLQSQTYGFKFITNHHVDITEKEQIKDIECPICSQKMDKLKSNYKLNFSGYKYKNDLIPFTAIMFSAFGFHFYTFRRINDIWISYDSYKVKTPTPISDKFISRLILNSLLSINNFNGHYSGRMAYIEKHFDLLDNDPLGYLNDTNENITADKCKD